MWLPSQYHRFLASPESGSIGGSTVNLLGSGVRGNKNMRMFGYPILRKGNGGSIYSALPIHYWSNCNQWGHNLSFVLLRFREDSNFGIKRNKSYLEGPVGSAYSAYFACSSRDAFLSQPAARIFGKACDWVTLAFLGSTLSLTEKFVKNKVKMKINILGSFKCFLPRSKVHSVCQSLMRGPTVPQS